MGTCAICEDIQGEEEGIRQLEWYVWWRWTWKIKLWWYRWRHDRNDHYWQWKDKLRLKWAYNIYWSIKHRYMDWRLEMTEVKYPDSTWIPKYIGVHSYVEFYCEGCDDFMFRMRKTETCDKCGGQIKRKKSTVENMAKLTKRLDEEKERENMED